MPDGRPPIDAALVAAIDARIDERVGDRLDGIEAQIAAAFQSARQSPKGQLDRATLVVFSGDMDRMMSAFIIANGAAAMGFEVSMYFTFWGLVALKKETLYRGKPLDQKLVTAMLPDGPQSAGPSKMAFGGAGGAFFRRLMAKHHVASLPELIDTAVEMGVKMVACRMAMGVMGITDEELREGIEYGGVGTYLGDALDSKLTLFI